MNKIINADDLLDYYKDEDYFDEDFVGCIRKKIKELPTVKAIPVSWVEEHIRDILELKKIMVIGALNACLSG